MMFGDWLKELEESGFFEDYTPPVALASLAWDAAQPKWQPIESAPINGSPFLACRSDDGMVWIQSRIGPIQISVGVGDACIFATHWMPLPSTPEPWD